MLLNILLVILVLVCIALTGVILLQRSEGGALGMGGGPSGMFTARGAGDLLTRTTSILAGAFFVLSLTITLLAGHERASSSVTQRLKVNPIDLSAMARSSAAAAQSSAPAAPAMPNQAPRPTLGRVARTAPLVVPNVTLPDLNVAPRPTRSPRPAFNAGLAPASSSPPAGQ